MKEERYQRRDMDRVFFLISIVYYKNTAYYLPGLLIVLPYFNHIILFQSDDSRECYYSIFVTNRLVD